MPTGRVFVVGSVNLDLVHRVPRLPRPGETVLGSTLTRVSGGKGGNQAHAAARVAGHPGAVTFVGAVGADDPGRQLRADLAAVGVDVTGVAEVDAPSGVALIAVDDAGENTIVVIPGANAAWGPDLLDAVRPVAGDVVVTQGEIPRAVTAEALRRARVAGARTIFNAAPADREFRALLTDVDVLVVNEGEARAVLGLAEPSDVAALAAAAGSVGCAVVVTLGERGALVAEPGSAVVAVPAPRVDAVDTVGAGDAFVGGLAAALAGGQNLVDAVRWGTAAGTLTATVAGARHPELTREAVAALATAVDSQR